MEKSELAHINDIADICHEKRIKRFCYRDGPNESLELEFDLPPTKMQVQAAQEIADIMSNEETVTDEEILLNPYAGIDGQKRPQKNKG